MGGTHTKDSRTLDSQVAAKNGRLPFIPSGTTSEEITVRQKLTPKAFEIKIRHLQTLITFLEKQAEHETDSDKLLQDWAEINELQNKLVVLILYRNRTNFIKPPPQFSIEDHPITASTTHNCEYDRMVFEEEQPLLSDKKTV